MLQCKSNDWLLYDTSGLKWINVTVISEDKIFAYDLTVFET